MPQNRSDYEGLPTPGPARPEDVIEDLGDGLLLRRAREEDIEANAVFQAVVQADPPDFSRLDHIGNWVRQLMDGSHPTCRAPDFLLVHDTRKDLIASSLGLLSHRLAYDGIEIPAGMPELVGTHPDYRHRRLVARQFDEVHRWSEERGDLLQMVDGIPWYYRQFGYEMAVQRHGGLDLPPSALPKEMPEGLRVREAIQGDAAFIARTYDHAMRRYRLTCNRDESFWEFELAGREGFTTVSRKLEIVETVDGEPRAVFNHVPILLAEGHTWTPFLEVAPGVDWSAPLEAALHFLRELGTSYAVRDEETFAGAALVLGVDHPAYRVLEGSGGRPRRPYAWYLRVPDLPAFLRRVGPALAARLVGTPYEGHRGTLALSFYRTGARLRFEKGELAEVSAWRPATDDIGDAAFPDLTFLDLLFGHRSVGELADARPDVQIHEQEGLLRTLFPEQPSFLMATS